MSSSFFANHRIEMETKLQIVFCVLLFSNLGSAVLGQETASPSSLTDESFDLGKPGVPPSLSKNPPSSSSPEAAGSESLPSPHSPVALTPEVSSTSNSSNNNIGGAISTNNNTATAVEQASPTPLVQHPTTASLPDNQKDATSMDLPVIPTSQANDGNLPEPSSPAPPLPPSDGHTTSTHTPLTTTTPSQTHTVHTSSTHTLHTIAPQNTTPHSTHSHTPPHPTSPSSHSTHPFTHHSTTHSPPSASPAPPIKPHHTETTTVTSTQSSSTASSSVPKAVPDPQLPSTPSPVATVDSGPQPQTSSPPHPDSTFIPPSSPSARADTPSQLNVGGDATVVHESPTLDPLLAGLVSAFIVTAVIITLLLFLKLRRRDNRPEFRRLQDLPMDDMMEDTPLSMYNY